MFASFTHNAIINAAQCFVWFSYLFHYCLRITIHQHYTFLFSAFCDVCVCVSVCCLFGFYGEVQFLAQHKEVHWIPANCVPCVCMSFFFRVPHTKATTPFIDSFHTFILNHGHDAFNAATKTLYSTQYIWEICVHVCIVETESCRHRSSLLTRTKCAPALLIFLKWKISNKEPKNLYTHTKCPFS